MFTPPPSPLPFHQTLLPGTPSPSGSRCSSPSPSPAPSPSRFLSPLPSPVKETHFDSDPFLSPQPQRARVPSLTPPATPHPPRRPSINIPKPPRRPSFTFSPPTPPGHSPSPASVASKKRSIGRRLKYLSLLIVPAVLILITVSTRYMTHPAVLDVFSPSRDWAWDSTLTLRAHKRHEARGPQDSGSGSGQSVPASGSGTATGSATVTGSGSGSASPSATSSGSAPPAASGGGAAPASTGSPTIPTTRPPLPTPFPQPFDTLSQNFTTQMCENFFLNMTQTTAFRSCRPFSLLLSTSAAFIGAQSNITLLNDLMWGTCNTNTDAATCVSNMAWFGTEIQTACSTELGQKNAMAMSALTGLLSYSLMRTAGCLPDESTNTYCYLDAVSNTNPSDLYFYQLPLGQAIPNTTTPSCSACTKSLMAQYVPYVPAAAGTSQAANDTANAAGAGGKLAALGNGVYADAATLASKSCGAGYVTNVANSARGTAGTAAWWWYALALAGAIVASVC